jgi:sugar fermentation stimulation protein A
LFHFFVFVVNFGSGLSGLGKGKKMLWPKLVRGILIKRYKRFMVDVKLQNGHVVTAHCPNTGSMSACCEPGRPVYLSRHNNPARRLHYTFELIEMPTSLVGVNTAVPNRLVREAICDGAIQSLSGYDSVRPEVRYGVNSRIDLLLESQKRGRCFVEIKNCTLVEQGIAYFPDAVTARGLKHLWELQQQVQEGNRCVMFYLIQRTDAHLFKPADLVDPEYGKALRTAVQHGVEIMAWDVKISLEEIVIRKQVPCDLH